MAENENRGSSTEGDNPGHDDSVNEARREALKRLGRYGAYTAPAMIALLAPDKAAAVVS
jgi:hypothetical protein